MSAEIKEATGKDAFLIEGGGGIFEIRQDGDILWKKTESGVFPADGEADVFVHQTAIHADGFRSLAVSSICLSALCVFDTWLSLIPLHWKTLKMTDKLYFVHGIDQYESCS